MAGSGVGGKRCQGRVARCVQGAFMLTGGLVEVTDGRRMDGGVAEDSVVEGKSMTVCGGGGGV